MNTTDKENWIEKIRDTNSITEYIKSILSSQKQQILDMVEEMQYVESDALLGTTEETKVRAFNQALSDIKSKIEGLPN